MKNKIAWLALSALMVVAMVLTSCSTSSTTTTKPTSASTTTTASVSTTTTASVSTTTTASITTTMPTSTATTGNWWDTLGKPQYGGQMVLRLNKDLTNFDPIYNPGLATLDSAWMERLTEDDWTVNPTVYSYGSRWTPSQFAVGHLAQSWEFTDSSTYVVHIRQNVYWQNIAPANGRQFTADDVLYDYCRLFGLGDGFTKPSTYWGTVPDWYNLSAVTEIDKYTIAFKWKTPNPEYISEMMQGNNQAGDLASPDAVQLWGDVNNWHHAIGTGPFILSDFVSGSSATVVKNTNYWGYDERYPQNKLPYVDSVKFLIIPDDSTALAGLRTGKIDVIAGVSVQNLQSLQKTNPELLKASIPANNATTIDPRNDLKPFNDIRVREALQMSLDLPTIASTYYLGTVSPEPSSLTANILTGWGWPYDQWPQDLKDQYTYNPTAAKQLLAAAGYPNGFKTDIVVDVADDMNLMQIVKSSFASIGIDMEIRTMDSASWISFVGTNHKNDALAQRSGGVLGCMYEPTRELARFITGGAVNWLCISDPHFDAIYAEALAATSIDGVKQALIEGDKYVAQQHFAISLLQTNAFCPYWPWLKGFSGQFFGIPGPSDPMMVNFYQARMWIDQDMKKSMGY